MVTSVTTWNKDRTQRHFIQVPVLLSEPEQKLLLTTENTEATEIKGFLVFR